MIHYLSEGSGKTTLILLHGFCENNTCLKRQVLFFKDHCKVIAPDLPGFGRSEVISPVSIEAMAEKVYEVLVKENTSHCIMLGHSMGGYVTLAFAEKYPQMLKGFGLIHSTANADSEDRIEKRKQVISFIEENGLQKYVSNFIPTLFSENADNADIEFTIQEAVKGPVAGVIEAIRAMMNRPDRKHVLSNAQVPVLFVAGEKDQLIPSADVFFQSTLSNISQAVFLNRAAHMGMLEDANSLNREISKFIELCA